jgi:predicted acyltransferase
MSTDATSLNTTAAPSTEPTARRVISIDVYRGLVMFLMLFEMTHLEHFASLRKESSFWSFIHFHTSHVEWFGCSLHDLIQPGFSFLVGAALAFSLAARKSRGDSFGRMLGHVVIRSFILISLGIFLRSLDSNQTNFTFDDTLTQIGLGYTFLFLIAWLPTLGQFFALAVILIGYWAVFALYPVSIDFDYAAVGVAADWPYHRSGFESHWNKNSNAAWAFDTIWMNLFPRESPFIKSNGGYCTLSFIPTLGTMLLGLFAGSWLRTVNDVGSRLLRFIGAIAICMSLALVIDYAGLCPIVKKIWTPTWTLYSGAWCFAFLLALHLICDLKGYVAWSFPLRVIGANSIAAYVMSWTVVEWCKDNWRRHFGWLFDGFAEDKQTLIYGGLTFGLIWLVLLWMYRRKLFLRI